MVLLEFAKRILLALWVFCMVWVIYDAWHNKELTTGWKIFWTVFAVFFAVATAVAYLLIVKWCKKNEVQVPRKRMPR